jgi:ankyrin repeat protein
MDTVKYLVENGADVEVRNSFGQTPLIVAAINDQESIL